MFQGSLSAPGEYFTPLQQVGASQINGTTNTDRTNFFETVPSRYLPLALFLESDRMGHLLDVLDQAKLDNQREVVRNERRQNYENRPYGEWSVKLYEALYPEGHPYHHPTIGSHADLQAASIDDVKQFFRTWYAPSNASLVITGDFDPDTAKRLVQENFGWIPSAPRPQHAETAPASLPETKVVRLTDDVPDAKVWVAWLSPAVLQPGDAELDLAASVLCGGKDSRLYRRLVDASRIARDVGCFQASRRLSSAFVVAATAAEGHTTDEIVAAVADELGKLGTSAPPTADEVKGAVTDYEVGFWGGLQTVEGRAGILSSYLDLTGQPDYLAADLARYKGATPESVAAQAKATFSAPHVELHILPEAAPAAETPPPAPPKTKKEASR
jgi:predicted Zn-dependent peptidase